MTNPLPPEPHSGRGQPIFAPFTTWDWLPNLSLMAES